MKNTQWTIGIGWTNSEKSCMKADFISIVIVYDGIIQLSYLICTMLWLQLLFCVCTIRLFEGESVFILIVIVPSCTNFFFSLSDDILSVYDGLKYKFSRFFWRQYIFRECSKRVRNGFESVYYLWHCHSFLRKFFYMWINDEIIKYLWTYYVCNDHHAKFVG